MGTKRFKELGMGSFFGQYVYERVVPRDHFLVKLNELIHGDAFTDLLLSGDTGSAERGRPPASPNGA